MSSDRRTIYVSPENAGVYEKAQAILESRGESLSSHIATSLSRLVEDHEAGKDAMERMTISVGRSSGSQFEDDELREVSFIGRVLASKRVFDEPGQDTRGTTRTIYQTAKGQFVLHVEEWSRWQNESSYRWYKVYESLEALEKETAEYSDGDAYASLIQEAKKEMGEGGATFLDI